MFDKMAGDIDVLVFIPDFAHFRLHGRQCSSGKAFLLKILTRHSFSKKMRRWLKESRLVASGNEGRKTSVQGMERPASSHGGDCTKPDGTQQSHMRASTICRRMTDGWIPGSIVTFITTLRVVPATGGWY
jgi:hypothetical protein